MVNIINVSTTETKWTWLEKRLQAVQAEVDALAGQLQGLENTPYDGECMTCGVRLETEADFAKHYIVRDPRYLNLGECPTKLKQAEEQEKVDLQRELDHNAAHANRVARQERTYSDVVGPYKDVLHPGGL